MRCVINQLIELNNYKQKSTSVLLRYLRMKYKINMSRDVLENRIRKIAPTSFRMAS